MRFADVLHFRDAMHAVAGAIDLRRLRRRLPAFPNDATIAAARDDLADVYMDYVATVSTARMAGSLEAMAVLLAICRSLNPKTIIDLGSGFSSYVTRSYATTCGARAISVDDNLQWLDRTREFLDRHSLSTEDLYAWHDYERAPLAADVVFHDLAGGEQRESSMPIAARMARKVVVFDDAHSSHRGMMRRTAREQGLQLFSIRPITLDRFGRWSMLAVRD